MAKVTGILTLFFSEFFSRIALKYKVAPDNSYSEQVQDILIGPRANDLYMFHNLVSHWYPGSGVVLDCIDS